MAKVPQVNKMIEETFTQAAAAIQQIIRASNMSVAMPGYLSLKEAAAYLHTADSTLRGWVRTKGLPYHKPGKELLFRAKDLDAWMNRYRHGLTGLELSGFNDSRRSS